MPPVWPDSSRRARRMSGEVESFSYSLEELAPMPRKFVVYAHGEELTESALWQWIDGVTNFLNNSPYAPSRRLARILATYREEARSIKRATHLFTEEERRDYLLRSSLMMEELLEYHGYLSTEELGGPDEPNEWTVLDHWCDVPVPVRSHDWAYVVEGSVRKPNRILLRKNRTVSSQWAPPTFYSFDALVLEFIARRDEIEAMRGSTLYVSRNDKKYRVVIG